MIDVTISGRRLNGIYREENLAAIRHDMSGKEHLDNWCADYCKSMWNSWVEYNGVIWTFLDVNEAMVFKLTWA